MTSSDTDIMHAYTWADESCLNVVESFGKGMYNQDFLL